VQVAVHYWPVIFFLGEQIGAIFKERVLDCVFGVEFGEIIRVVILVLLTSFVEVADLAAEVSS